jgi:cytochrome c556
MKRAVFIAICMLVAGAAWSQSDADYRTWMKTIGATCGSLKKNLDAKNGEAAAADARKLHSAFADVHDFFQKKHSEDAMKFAMAASEGFDKIAAQASAGKFDEASATFKETTANCGSCHSAHREKAADGSFKIKY